MGQLARLGYAAVSALSGDSLPHSLMETFLRDDRRSFDGVFVMSEARTNAVIANNRVSAEVDQQRTLIRRAFQVALKGMPGSSSERARWATSIVAGLRAKRSRTKLPACEDITTADYADIVDGQRTRGHFVQLSPGELSSFISFGGLRLHFEGTATLTSFPGSQEEFVILRLAPVLTDTFDFHDGTGTGWMDHVLFRMQKRGDAKPFSIEGRGTPFTESVTASH